MTPALGTAAIWRENMAGERVGIAALRLILTGLVMLAGALLFVPGMPAQAQQRAVPQSASDLQLSFSPLVKEARPAVVNVYVRRRVRSFVSPFSGDPFFRRFFGREFGGMPRERMESSLGSGVIVGAEGIVVTNFHVIKGARDTEIKVALADRREFDATIVQGDEANDLAVLKINAPGVEFHALEFADSEQLEVGDLVLAIGNPFGVGQTVTSGIISGLARTQIGNSDSQFFIQTDAAINPGNSGGALVDMNGRLVGINTAIFSRSGGSHGIGFAIPANLVRPFVESAVTGRSVQRPWLGARLANVTRDLAEALNLERVAGAIINEVYSGGPAEEVGLRAGDVIMSVDGRSVDDPRALTYRLTTRGVGATVVLSVMRDGSQRDISMAIAAAPETKTVALSGQHPFDGAEVADLTAAFAEELGIDDVSGVVIVNVPRTSYAARLGLRRGDIIYGVEQREVRSVGELQELLSLPRRAWPLEIKRGPRIVQMVVPG